MICGHDGAGLNRFAESIVGGWHEAMQGVIQDFLTEPSAIFGLVVLPPPAGLEDGQVTGPACALVTRSLAEGSPSPRAVATVSGALRRAAAGAKGERRFDPPPGYSVSDRALLLAAVFALVTEAGP